MKGFAVSDNIKVFGLPSEKGRWIFIGLGVLINLCLGSIYSWSVFRKPLETLFNIGATHSGLPYTIFLVFFAALMPIAGILLEKYGPRRLAIIGGSIVGLGWFFSGFASNILFISICYGSITGAGVGITYGIPISVATKWFPDKKGIAVGLTLIGFGLSPLITAPVARILIEHYGPLHTFSILGPSFWVIIIACSLPLRFPPNDCFEVRGQNILNTTLCLENEITAMDMVKSTRFYGLWSCYIIGTFSGLMAIGISSPVGQEIIKLDAATAAIFVSLFAIFNGIGRPLFGWLTDRHTPRVTAIISFIIIFAVSMGMLTAGESDIWLYAICFCGFWLTLGGWLALAPVATATYFGMKDYSKKYGIVYTAYGVGAIFGTLICGRLRDVFGSYLYAFYPTACLAIIGILIAGFLLTKKKEIPDFKNQNSD
jgi:OFA family oxalate/formate antiporter-like MFS transporter